MTYRFKLEALRRYRKFQEEERQKAFSDSAKHRDRMVAEMDKKVAKRNETEKELNAQKNMNTNAQQILLFENFIKKISTDISVQRKKVAEAQMVCEEKRDLLMDAMKKRKALERIKEKDFERYMATLELKEAKFINEIAINRFALNQK